MGTAQPDMFEVGLTVFRSPHLRPLVAWAVVGMACGGWTSVTLYFGGLWGGSALAVALAAIPIALVLSAAVVAVFVEGSARPARPGLKAALGYILLANVLMVVNPLYFFPNYGAASVIYQRAAGALVALPLFSSALLAVVAYSTRLDLRATVRPFEIWLIAFFVGVTVPSFVIGLARANFVPFVVSDLAKDLIVPAAWIVFRYAARVVAPWELTKLIVGFAVLPPVIDLAYHVNDLWLDSPYERYGGYTALPLTFFVACLAFRARNSPQGGLLLGVSLMLLGSLLSLSRMTWFQASLVVGAGLWAGARTRRGSTFVVITAIIVASVFMGTVSGTFVELIEERFAEILTSHEDEFVGIGGGVPVGGLSGARKLTETYSVLAKYATGGLTEWLLGFGEGAEYEHLAPSPEIEAIYDFRDLRIHNVHNIVAQVLFRKGVIGVLVLTALLASFWRELRRLRQSLRAPEERIILWTVTVYFVISLVKSMSVDVMLGKVEWGALFAVIGSLARGLDRTARGATGEPAPLPQESVS